MNTKTTEADFKRLSWHDCFIWGIEFRAGDPEEGDWTSDLAFHIDFITEWLCGVDREAQFRVAPAELVFHDVTDPRIHLAWPDHGFRTSVGGVYIIEIERERVRNQKVCFDRRYYSWRIRVANPQGGTIEFGATGFTQTLLAEPVLTRNQKLSLSERRRLLGK